MTETARDLGNYAEQCSRIQSKLAQARAEDVDRKVFGASSHDYGIAPPATAQEIAEFERSAGIVLPDAYVAFLSMVGNGGGPNKPAAGPYYGIYALGRGARALYYDIEDGLKRPAALTPDLSDETWAEFANTLESDDVDDDTYDQMVADMCGGLMTIGSQGCTYFHALVLNGPYRGRVVNVDEQHCEKPLFAFEENFLDWYERWLDEILNGILLQDGPSWFGRTMGGDEHHLIGVYRTASSETTKQSALDGFYKSTDVSNTGVEFLLNVFDGEPGQLRRTAAALLAKFAPDQAIGPIGKLLDGDTDDLRTACQSIWWYFKDNLNAWTAGLLGQINDINDLQTARFISYILKDADGDFTGTFLAFARHPNDSIRLVGITSLRHVPLNEDIAQMLLEAMADENWRIVNAALVGHELNRDPRFLYRYRELARTVDRERAELRVNLWRKTKALGYEDANDFVAACERGEFDLGR